MLSVQADAKTVKGEKAGYLTGILYLAPHKLSGRNLCPDASPGCIATCLNTAGQGVFSNVQRARIAKTVMFREHRDAFMAELVKDIRALVRKAQRERMTPLVRLNGTSDLPWENIPAPHYFGSSVYTRESNLMVVFPDIQFYDYTKSFSRMGMFLSGSLPSNYHLTFSRSECNDSSAMAILDNGGNVAVVFSTRKGETLPDKWRGHEVIDGDINDARPSDVAGAYNGANGFASTKRHGVVVGLRAKSKARYDRSGFVIQVRGER